MAVAPSDHPPAHLAVLIPNLLGGGAERFAINISSELFRRGHRVDLVVGNLRGPLRDDVAEGVRLIELGRRHNSANLVRLIRYLRKERPDVLLSSQPGANVISVIAARLSRSNTRIVVTQHISLSGAQRNQARGWAEVAPANLGKAARGLALDRLARWAYPRADRIVAVSEGAARSLSLSYEIPSQSISVIYNPVVTARLVASKDEPADHPFFDQADEPVVLAVGRFEHQKGFDDLIEAFALLRRDTPAKLLLLGDGPKREALEELAVRSGVGDEVAMPGHVEHPVAFMRRGSVFVLSSRYEGLPTVLIEALYAGIPVVATDCESGPREILEDGKHGMLVPVGDAPALAVALEKALAGDVAEPSSTSWNRFTGEQSAAAYEQVMLEVKTRA